MNKLWLFMIKAVQTQPKIYLSNQYTKKAGEKKEAAKMTTDSTKESISSILKVKIK